MIKCWISNDWNRSSALRVQRNSDKKKTWRINLIIRFNTDQTYSNVLLSRRLCNLYDHVHVMNNAIHIDFHASYDMDHILQWLMAPFRLSAKIKNSINRNAQSATSVCGFKKKRNVLITSVRAQLQLIAVHKKIFINNIIKNKMPKVIHNHNSQAGRKASSHTGETTVNANKIKPY